MEEQFARSERTSDELARTREERLVPHNSDLQKIIRYESHLQRLVGRNLRDLEAIQSQRLGRPVHLHRHL